MRPLNHAPLVEAGPDVAGLVPGATITLQGSVSDDGLPDGTLIVAWSQVSGPAPAVLTSPSLVTTAASFPAAGAYVLRLTASDGAQSVDRRPAGPGLARQPAAERRRGTGPRARGSRGRAGAGRRGVGRRPARGSAHRALDGERARDGRLRRPGRVATTARFGSPGRYVLRLAASDGALSSADEATVLVGSPDRLPDLVVRQVDASSLVIDPRSLVASGAVVVEIANPGPGTAAAPFTLTVFEDRDASGTFGPGVDAVLGEQEVAGLEAGGSLVVEVAAAGSVQFAGNLVYAFVDSGLSVVEADEANNTASSSPGCGAPGSAEGWSVALEWGWTTTAVDPVSTLVVNAPIVIDVDGDAVPDVLFVAHGTRRDAVGYAYDGRLRALGGRDGHEIWSVTDPALALTGGGRLAAADIDGDGRPEIVGLASGGTTLVAFEHDGTFKWRSDTILNAGWGAPSIADLDGDGVPEIVIGRQVLTNEGRLLWTGAFSGQGGDRGAHSLVVDLDLDGQPEVLVGNTAYRGQGPVAGQVLWRNTSTVGGVAVQDGYTAVGNFDDDPYPEIVLAARGWIFLLEHDGTVKWGPTFLEPVRSGAWAGPPTVADVDGDGAPEIAVAGSNYLTVFETDGSVKWRAPNQDSTPNVGVVAFDFDGDGAAELVHAAELDLRIFRGSGRRRPVPGREREPHGVGLGRGRRRRRRRGGRDRLRDRRRAGGGDRARRAGLRGGPRALGRTPGGSGTSSRTA